MGKRLQTVTSQKFTGLGKLGIGLLLAGPVICAIGYNWLLSEMSRPYGGSALGPALFMLLGSFSLLGSLPMMLIGREHNQIFLEMTDKPTETQN